MIDAGQWTRDYPCPLASELRDAAFEHSYRISGGTAAGDDQDCVVSLEGRPQLVGIITAVGDHPHHPDSIGDQQIGAPDVGRVPRRQDKAERATDDIHERMDPGSSTTLADICHGFFASAYGSEGMWVAAGD